jgi:hypothetical protein
LACVWSATASLSMLPVCPTPKQRVCAGPGSTQEGRSSRATGLCFAFLATHTRHPHPSHGARGRVLWGRRVSSLRRCELGGFDRGRACHRRWFFPDSGRELGRGRGSSRAALSVLASTKSLGRCRLSHQRPRRPILLLLLLLLLLPMRRRHLQQLCPGAEPSPKSPASQ